MNWIVTRSSNSRSTWSHSSTSIQCFCTSLLVKKWEIYQNVNNHQLLKSYVISIAFTSSCSTNNYQWRTSLLMFISIFCRHFAFPVHIFPPNRLRDISCPKPAHHTDSCRGTLPSYAIGWTTSPWFRGHIPHPFLKQRLQLIVSGPYTHHVIIEVV